MPKASAKGMASSSALDLETKSVPSRQQGKDTFETIVATAGELLSEVGFERLTTNLVCERAGLTPPALYRYFPNKYALLAELARRLMEAQDDVFCSWLDQGNANSRTIEEAVARSISLQKELVRVTRSQSGGMSILRAIRAVPALQQVRIESRDKVLAQHLKSLRQRRPDVPEAQLRSAVRLSEEVAYGVIEMILEDPQLDEDRIITEAAWMSSLYYQNMKPRQPAKRARSKTAKPSR